MADFNSNGFTQAYFSSRGPTLDGRVKPDVSAPGVGITSAVAGTPNGYADLDGTSMATPFVAGLTLLMLDQNPALTPQQVKDKIMQTAIDWARGGNNQTTGTSGADIDYGAGRLDAYAALQSAGATDLHSAAPTSTRASRGHHPSAGAQVDFALDVTDTTFPIGATLIIPAITGGTSNSLDFDLYLFDHTGAEVAASEFTTRQEEIGFKPPRTGTYTLRVEVVPRHRRLLCRRLAPEGRASVRGPGARPRCASPAGAGLRRLREPEQLPRRAARPALMHAGAPGVAAAHHLHDRQGRGLRAPGRASRQRHPAADEADLRIAASATDVRKSSDGSDYAGKVILTTALRITDRGNGSSRTSPGRCRTSPSGFRVDCVATPDPAIGSGSSLNTTADTLFARLRPGGQARDRLHLLGRTAERRRGRMRISGRPPPPPVVWDGRRAGLPAPGRLSP